MIALVQRVSHASVTVDGKVTGEIGKGMLILLGVFEGDTVEDMDWVVKKCSLLRIFDDDNGVMNRNVSDVGGDVLAVSQFTLCANIRKGNRPSYIAAMEPVKANEYYERFCAEMAAATGRRVERGIFGADMAVELCNDGPVTIIVDSSKK